MPFTRFTLNIVVAIFVAAVAMGALFTWLARRFALRFGIVSHPNPLVPQHREPIAYLGGVAVALTVLTLLWPVCFGPIAGALGITKPPPISAYLTGSLLFLLIGVVDDLRPLAPRPKFLYQLMASIIALTIGIRALHADASLATILICVLWIVLFVNAVNLTDVCDGLVGGLCVVSCSYLGVALAGQNPLPLIAAGACIGFLFFNRPPATIFLGDAGSHFLGFLLAGFALESLFLGPSLTTAATVSLAIAVPLFELVFLIVVRTRKGLPWWRGSPDHFSLRLQAAGLDRAQTILTAWTVAIVMGGAGLLLHGQGPWVRMTTIAAAVGFLVVAGRLLMAYEVPVSRRTRDENSRTRSAKNTA